MPSSLGRVSKIPPRYQPYHTQQGEPQLVDAFVLFLDLLGTKASTAKEAERNLEVTARALKRANDWAGGSDAGSTVVKWFSDNLALADLPDRFPGQLPFGFQLITAAWMQLDLAMMGLVSRGGMTRGPFFANDMFVYGPALIEAYELESSTAIYPRIALSASLAADALEELAEVGGGSTEVHRKLLAVDEDGVVFVDYLSSIYDEPDEVEAFLRNHKDHIEAQLDQHRGDPHVHLKYRWLAEYHDRFCRRGFVPEYRERLVIGPNEGPELEALGQEVPVPAPPESTGLEF